MYMSYFKYHTTYMYVCLLCVFICITGEQMTVTPDLYRALFCFARLL